MKKYGLTGNPLGHSISPEIHGLLNNKAEYKLYPATDLKGEFLRINNFYEQKRVTNM
jgi:shikimate 5-dehydrogenase